MRDTSFEDIEITYIVPVYIEKNSCFVLDKLIERYEKYDQKILNRISFVFVDDCSPIEISIKTSVLNYKLVRIIDDIPWNQPGARNLGVFLARSSKLILTDLDHIFPEEVLSQLLKSSIPERICTFRRTKNGKKTRSHPNTFFCTKSLFYKSLGVDEEFSGFYGYDDVHFIELQKRLGTKFRKIRRYPIEVVEHSESVEDNYHDLKRDSTRNFELLQKKRTLLKSDKPFMAHSRLHLNFKWKEISKNKNA